MAMEFENELNKAIDAIKLAGAEVINIYNSNYEVNIKGDKSPVTKADLTSEKIIIKELKNFGYGFVAEESGVTDTKSNFYWVIDPLDGTKDFIQKTGDFSIMIGLLRNKEPVLGVVYAPAIDKLWYAIKNNGAYCISKGKKWKINVSDEVDLKKFRLVISRFHFRQEDKDVADRLGITSFEKMGSVGIKYSRIAEGDAELCVYTTGFLGLWDCCAPHIILKEAGGYLMDINGDEPGYNFSTLKMDKGFIGTNGKNIKDVMESIKKIE